MKFLLGLMVGVVLTSAVGLSAQDTGTYWTPGGQTGSYSHNSALGSTWYQDSYGNGGYFYSAPTMPFADKKKPC